jgi:formate C-acetyltransferase
MKLRLIRHLRTPEYNELFAGDPTWVTEAIGGMMNESKSYVTKTSFRFIHSLINLGIAPEPNLTILWDEALPDNFKRYCAKMSIKTNALQYENDKLMREKFGNDYGIACCVSAMKIGEQMQFFGARCNLAKALLYAIHEGEHELSGEVVVPHIPPLINKNELDFQEVMENYKKVLRYVGKIYVQANNIIHYMHDKYAYEASQMALHDTEVDRLMAFGISGYSVVVDSLSAIKYGKTKVVRNSKGISKYFTSLKDFPKYGNDIQEVDNLGIEVIKYFKE